jgi:antitoxin ParD1/3/4
MAMNYLRISLPELLKEYGEGQVSEARHNTPSEYLRELRRADQKRRLEQILEALLRAGLDSGTPMAITPEYQARSCRRASI